MGAVVRDHHGAFLLEVAWGLIGFDSLAAYEAYRARLKADPEGRENFLQAQRERFILREERTFCELVEGTLAERATPHMS